MSRPTVEERQSIHKDLPPLESGDSDLVLDIDFTAGQAAVEAILETTEGFSRIGSNATAIWDSVKGLNPDGQFSWKNDDWSPTALASRADMYAGDGWTFHVEVERAAIASTWKDSQSGFIDSAIGPMVIDEADFTQGVNKSRFLCSFMDPDDAVNSVYCNLYWSLLWNVAESVNSINSRTVNGGAGTPWGKTKVFSDGRSDEEFISIDFTADFKSQTIETYMDGHLVHRGGFTIDHGSATNYDYFKRCSLLGTNGTSPFKGFIKRIQITKRRSKNRVPIGIKLGLFGDSNTQRATSRATPSPVNVANIDAAQNFLDTAYSREESDEAINPFIKHHPNPWGVKLSMKLADAGAPISIYNAAESGQGYETGANQIDVAFRNALIAHNPEFIICLGSVNDVTFETPTAQLEVDTKAILDEFIDGCSNLKKILFLTTPPIIGNDLLIGNPVRAALVIEHVAMQNTLTGYRDKVVVVDTFNGMGGNDANPEYTEGSHPLVASYDAASSTSNEGANVHLGMTGMNKVVELAYPVLKNMIISR